MRLRHQSIVYKHHTIEIENVTFRMIFFFFVQYAIQFQCSALSVQCLLSVLSYFSCALLVLFIIIYQSCCNVFVVLHFIFIFFILLRARHIVAQCLFYVCIFRNIVSIAIMHTQYCRKKMVYKEPRGDLIIYCYFFQRTRCLTHFSNTLPAGQQPIRSQ